MTPGRLDDEMADLAGAYVLDALEPEEAEAFEARCAVDGELGAEVARLANAAAWIGAIEALTPPPSLRASVLRAARARRVADDPALDCYRAQAHELLETLVAIPATALGARTTNGLDVRELVIHCVAQESLLTQLAGVPAHPAITAVDVAARTAAFVALAERARWSPADIRDELVRTVSVVGEWASSNRDATIPWLGADIGRDDVLVIRAFESWIHADDLRRALGIPLQAPRPRHLALMADLAGRTLSVAVVLRGRARPGKTARLVLTGAGGGAWLVPMGGGEAAGEPDVTLTADAVAWCRLVGERLAPAELIHTAEGETELVADLLASATAFATL